MPSEKMEHLTDAFFAGLAKEAPPRLPSAAQVYWRGQVVRRLAEHDAAAARATRPAFLGAGLAGAAVVTGLLLAGGTNVSFLLAAAAAVPLAGLVLAGLVVREG